MDTPKAFLFDVFGTVVDLRHSLTTGLMDAAEWPVKNGTISDETRARLKLMTPTHWLKFTLDWLEDYGQFNRSFMPGISEWVNNGEMRIRSLRLLLAKRCLSDLWDEQELQRVNQLWHKLVAWPDSAHGIAMLNELGITGTLSNGSRPVLQGLVQHNNIPFTKIFCSDDFKAYKPSPLVYQGAIQRLYDGTEREGTVLKPGEVAMVAAHLYDLEAAKALGMRTIYIERPLEENSSPEEIAEIRGRPGLIDMWVEDGLGGIEEVAKRLRKGT